MFFHDHVMIDPEPAVLELASNATVTTPPCATPRFSTPPLGVLWPPEFIVKLAMGEARIVIDAEADWFPLIELAKTL